MCRKICNENLENRLTNTKVMAKNIFELGIFYKKNSRKNKKKKKPQKKQKKNKKKKTHLNMFS